MKQGSNLNQVADYANVGWMQQDSIEGLLKELHVIYERDFGRAGRYY